VTRPRPGSRRRARGTACAVLSLSLALLLGVVPGAAARVVDAADDGSLRPPTAPRYADPAWYDIVEVRLLDGDPIRVSVTLGAVDPSGGLPVGITQPIIEVYLDTGPGGAEALLPGSGLAMPLGDGWQVALRITGDGAWGWLADPDGQVDLARPQPLEVLREERELTLLTPFARPEQAPRIYAISGVYDPFRADGWRPLAREPSAWSFSSPTQQVPVVDVFPADPTSRAAALARGELPRTALRSGLDAGTWLWLGLMVAGLLVALAGLVVRGVAARPPVRPLGPPATSGVPGVDPPLIEDADVADSLLTRPTAAAAEPVARSETETRRAAGVEPTTAAPPVVQPERLPFRDAVPALPAPTTRAGPSGEAGRPAETGPSGEAPAPEGVAGAGARSSETVAPSDASREAKRS
jgi:hypothetical protein